jgi:hypothetical protein
MRAKVGRSIKKTVKKQRIIAVLLQILESKAKLFKPTIYIWFKNDILPKMMN